MKFIQVGVGGFGKVWLKTLGGSARAKIAGLVDINAKALDEACAAAGVDRALGFASLKDARAAGVQADAVVCVTPPEFHRAAVEEALAAGYHVICEKPMAGSIEDSRAMVKAAAKAGRVCVISQNYRYRPSMWTLADAVRRGAIGAIGQVKIDFYLGNDFHGGFRHAMDFPVLVDMSIHHFDLIRFVTGLDPVAVRGEAWNPPWSNYKGDCSSSVVFEMSNGARVVYNASWCAKGQYCDWNGNWQVEGDKGCLVYTREVVTLNEAPDLYKVASTTPLPLLAMARQGQDYVLEDFIDAVGAGRRPATDVGDNIHSVGMVFAAVEAVKTGRRVTID